MRNIPQLKSKINKTVTVENLYRKVRSGVIVWETQRCSIDMSQNMGRQYICALNSTLEPNCLYEIWARIIRPQMPGENDWSSPLLAYRNHYGLSLKRAKYLKKED